MTSFSNFKEIVRNLGGKWALPSIEFNRTQSEYDACYHRGEPDEDHIHLIAPCGLWMGL